MKISIYIWQVGQVTTPKRGRSSKEIENNIEKKRILKTKKGEVPSTKDIRLDGTFAFLSINVWLWTITADNINSIYLRKIYLFHYEYLSDSIHFKLKSKVTLRFLLA